MSLGSILSIAGSALSTHQKAVEVVSHNISNAATEGYSRQRALLSARHPLITPYGAIGTGVRVAEVDRVRDAWIDASIRREAAPAAEFRTRYDQLRRIEALYGEPSDTGLHAALDAFWSAWSDLASNPAGQAERSVVRERGAQVALQLNRLADGLAQLRAGVQDQLGADVARFNQLATQVAELNAGIVAAEAGGGTAGDLRDARDQALDEMAGLAQVQVIEAASGAVRVTIGGVSIVDGSVTQPLEARDLGGSWSIGLVGRPAVVSAVGGRLRALADTLGEIGAQRTGLDALAAAVVTAVNSAHQAGTNPLGETGVEFFDATGVSAASIALSAAVAGDARRIAAGAGAGGYQAGANDVAVQLATLRHAVNAGLGGSFSDYYTGIVAELGARVAGARDSADVHETLLRGARAERASNSGVSIDEELVLLMRHQTAYAAAARLVDVADEMLRTVLELG